jgi:hypothetical protein
MPLYAGSDLHDNNNHAEIIAGLAFERIRLISYQSIIQFKRNLLKRFKSFPDFTLKITQFPPRKTSPFTNFAKSL